MRQVSKRRFSELFKELLPLQNKVCLNAVIPIEISVAHKMTYIVNRLMNIACVKRGSPVQKYMP